MKQTGASGLASVFQGDRFHVGDIRAQRNEEQRNANAVVRRRDDEFVNEFKQMQLSHENDMVEEFARFVPRQANHEFRVLDEAFDMYLHRGVSSMRPAHEGAHQIPFAILMERAMQSVQSAAPGMSRRQVESKAVEMLHNLKLDACRGRPHQVRRRKQRRKERRI
jgi:hypothetical protein